jgi:hypothetical protein
MRVSLFLKKRDAWKLQMLRRKSSRLWRGQPRILVSVAGKSHSASVQAQLRRQLERSHRHWTSTKLRAHSQDVKTDSKTTHRCLPALRIYNNPKFPPNLSISTSKGSQHRSIIYNSNEKLCAKVTNLEFSCCSGSSYKFVCSTPRSCEESQAQPCVSSPA